MKEWILVWHRSKLHLSANISSFTDYAPFGSALTGRSGEFSFYRHSHNGQEKDDEVYGKGNLNSALFWMYDTRIARRWNMDPKPNPSLSNYATFGNNPIMFSDVLGDTTDLFNKNGVFIGSIPDNLTNQVHFLNTTTDYETYKIANYWIFKGKDESEVVRSNSIGYIGINSIKALNKIVDKSAKMMLSDNFISSGLELGIYASVTSTREILFSELKLPSGTKPNSDPNKGPVWTNVVFPINLAIETFKKDVGNTNSLFGVGHTHVDGYHKSELSGVPLKNTTQEHIHNYYYCCPVKVVTRK